MKTKSRTRWMLLLLAASTGSVVDLGLLRGTAHAIIGRPLTPMSYAGVARRTTRRTVAVGAAAYPYYAAPRPYYW